MVASVIIWDPEKSSWVYDARQEGFTELCSGGREEGCEASRKSKRMVDKEGLMFLAILVKCPVCPCLSKAELGATCRENLTSPKYSALMTDFSDIFQKKW